MFSKEPLIRTKEKYDNIAKEKQNIISIKQKEIREIQLEINDLTIKLGDLTEDVKQVQTEMLKAIAKSEAVKELLDNNELFK